jgi:hypothetical protein
LYKQVFELLAWDSLKINFSQRRSGATYFLELTSTLTACAKAIAVAQTLEQALRRRAAARN